MLFPLAQHHSQAVNHGRKSSGSKSTSSELLATFVLVISDLIQKEDLFGARKTQGSGNASLVKASLNESQFLPPARSARKSLLLPLLTLALLTFGHFFFHSH